MTGTIVNTAAIAAGGVLGCIIQRGLPKRLERALTQMQGLAILIIGFNGVITSMLSADPATGRLTDQGGLLLLVSLVLGVLAGELLRIEDRLNSLGLLVERKLGAKGFAKGFVSASLVFCIGAMAIIGAINDGLRQDSSVLFLKSAIDFVCALVMASALGFGVIFSAVSVLFYQGAVTLLSGLLSPLISQVLLDSICMVGYSIVACIGMNFLFRAKIKTANLLPALLVPILWEVLQRVAACWFN